MPKTKNPRRFRFLPVWGIIGAVFIVFLAVCFLYKVFLYQEPQRPAVQESENDVCRVCYLLNLDGMKGLGHSALLLIDEQGNGKIFSYNGMQYNLFLCLLGKEGIGKMKTFDMNAQETEEFLAEGKPPLLSEETAAFEECTDFDRILYRYISREEYEQILQGTYRYIEAGTQYEILYAKLHGADASSELLQTEIQEQIDTLLAQEQTPKYQIYTHNCDTAARELIARADAEMALYNQTSAGLIPSGNYKKMCRIFGEEWGCGVLGEDTLIEKLL